MRPLEEGSHLAIDFREDVEPLPMSFSGPENNG